MKYKTDAELRIMLQAQIDKIGSIRAWADANGVSKSLVGRALFEAKPLPLGVATALGFERAKDAPRWSKQPE